ncbi:hypothetical protein [Mesorhizobium sp. M1406]|uniref:hypothetical protein n=1 Tax=Mesorhizobium sp. M1406 TaxID=2957099 RepID=UPI00333950D7
MKPVLKADCSAGQIGEAIPFETAVAKAIALAKPVRYRETVSLVGALGRVCAADICSPISLPAFDNSAMDGFAVRTADFDGEGPWTFRLAERVVAGDVRALENLDPRTALRIFTGAPVPWGLMPWSCKSAASELAYRHDGQAAPSWSSHPFCWRGRQRRHGTGTAGQGPVRQGSNLVGSGSSTFRCFERSG